jgi:hypothetical protein
MTLRGDRLASLLPVAPLVVFVTLVLAAWAPSAPSVAQQAVVRVSGVPHPLALARQVVTIDVVGVGSPDPRLH